MDRLADIKCRAPNVMLYAAGGVRGGTTRVLVASALHDGRLNGANLAAAASKNAGDAE